MCLILFVTFILLLFGSCSLFSRLTCGYTRSSACLQNKTAIITGGNSGIGYQVCLNLASRGCRVIIADKDDSQSAKQKIIEFTGNTNVVSKILDLSDFRSIRNFAKEIISSEEKLDFIVHNAGIASSEKSLTVDGLNAIFQVNYFGPFLLTHLLIGLLKKSAPSRVVFTSSVLAFTSMLSVKSFKSSCYRKKSSALNNIFSYADSKLALLLAAKVFAGRLKNSGVTVNSLHPGVIRTPIMDNFFNSTKSFWFWAIFVKLSVYVSGKSVWEGAQTTIHLVVSNKLKNVSGKFFLDCIQFFEPFQARNLNFCETIWRVSEDCVKLDASEKF